jgi:hypothetical protein
MRTHRRLSDAERDQRREQDRQRLQQAAEQLLDSDGWRRWVRVRSRNGLARYSLVICGLGCRGRDNGMLSDRRLSLTDLELDRESVAHRDDSPRR